MKKISDKVKVCASFAALLLIALLSDFSNSAIEKGIINRAELGGEKKKLELSFDIDGLVENHTLTMEVMPVLPTKETAECYFSEVIDLIDCDFESVVESVPLKNTYLDGVVEADWSFQPAGIIDSTGEIIIEKLEKEETIIHAQVELTCGAYEKIYTFSFFLQRPQLSETEQLLMQLKESLNQQMEQEGKAFIELPPEIGGKEISWSKNKDYITPKIIFLEAVGLLLFWVILKRKKAEEKKKQLQIQEEDYPDIVSQLSLLLGAGMTTRQAWSRLAAQYTYKRKKSMIAKRPVYEAVLRMNGRLLEGESERVVYQQFREEISAPCYHKLMRILLGSLEKGNQGIAMRLEEESRLAFEQRITQIKKRGEEASTKMLGPLMLMMMIVMGIVMFPALMSFYI